MVLYHRLLSPTHIEIVLIWIVEDFHQVDNVGVVEFLQDGYLPVNPFQKMHWACSLLARPRGRLPWNMRNIHMQHYILMDTDWYSIFTRRHIPKKKRFCCDKQLNMKMIVI